MIRMTEDHRAAQADIIAFGCERARGLEERSAAEFRGVEPIHWSPVRSLAACTLTAPLFGALAGACLVWFSLVGFLATAALVGALARRAVDGSRRSTALLTGLR
jgi:hypothetical protein